MSNTYEWLKHIETSIPEEAYGYPVSMYSVALEGWRRGLSLSFRNNFRVKAVTPYILSGYGKEIEFTGTRSNLVKRKAINICCNKEITKQYLLNSGVMTPNGEVFDQQTNNTTIVTYANDLGYPVVLKPTNESGGKGVIANITNESKLKNALTYVRSELGHSKVMLEKYVDGQDYRIYVIGDKAVGAFYRTPANVVGDGKHTIKQLFQLKRKSVRKTLAFISNISNLKKKLQNYWNHRVIP